MDRKTFKEATLPVLYGLGEGVSAVKFVTPRGTDYTDYVADKLFNAVEGKLSPHTGESEEFGIRTFRNVQVCAKVELILKPEHMNSVFTWHQIREAIMFDDKEFKNQNK